MTVPTELLGRGHVLLRTSTLRHGLPHTPPIAGLPTAPSHLRAACSVPRAQPTSAAASPREPGARLFVTATDIGRLRRLGRGRNPYN
jgi:hypothetical protein